MVVMQQGMECSQPTVDMVQQPQYQSSPFSPQFGGGIGSMFHGMVDTAVDMDNLLSTAAVMQQPSYGATSVMAVV
jgi:hypothetical protein